MAEEAMPVVVGGKAGSKVKRKKGKTREKEDGTQSKRKNERRTSQKRKKKFHPFAYTPTRLKDTSRPHTEAQST